MATEAAKERQKVRQVKSPNSTKWRAIGNASFALGTPSQHSVGCLILETCDMCWRPLFVSNGYVKLLLMHGNGLCARSL